jgi:hypothetical protein
VLLAKYNYNDEVEEDGMGRACSTHGGEADYTYDFGGAARRKQTSRKT